MAHFLKFEKGEQVEQVEAVEDRLVHIFGDLWNVNRGPVIGNVLIMFSTGLQAVKKSLQDLFFRHQLDVHERRAVVVVDGDCALSGFVIRRKYVQRVNPRRRQNQIKFAEIVRHRLKNLATHLKQEKCGRYRIDCKDFWSIFWTFCTGNKMTGCFTKG